MVLPLNHLGAFLYDLAMNENPSVNLNPSFIHDIALSFAAFALASEENAKDACLLAGMNLPDLGSFGDEELSGYLNCLFSLSSKREFIDIDGNGYPLMGYDPEDKDMMKLAPYADILFGLFGYYLYHEKQIEKPSLILRPISFIFYEVKEGLEEGLGLSTPLAKNEFEKYHQFVSSASGKARLTAQLDYIHSVLA